MFTKFFYKRRFLNTLREQIWTNTTNAKFAKQAYDDLIRIQEKDVDLLNMHEEDLNKLSDATNNPNFNTKENRDAIKSLKAKIKNVESKVDTREGMLEKLQAGIADKYKEVETYQSKYDFVKKNV